MLRELTRSEGWDSCRANARHRATTGACIDWLTPDCHSLAYPYSISTTVRANSGRWVAANQFSACSAVHTDGKNISDETEQQPTINRPADQGSARRFISARLTEKPSGVSADIQVIAVSEYRKSVARPTRIRSIT